MSHRVARFTYQAVRSEGGMLPHELLEQVGAHSAELGISSTAYYLAEHEPLGEAQSRAWLRLAGLWRSFKAERAKLSDTDAAVRLTRERWLLPLFHELGYGRLTTAKGGLVVDGREFPISHIHPPAVPLHLMGAGVNLDRRAPGVSGAAQTSPHGLVQDFLNRSEPHLWGVVSNGLVLRLLRDSHTFTRRPYLEFDLEAIFDGELFSDFRLLWLCAHASRLSPAEATPDDPHSAAIEHWFTRAKDEGVRVRDRLRDGVQQAIERLGAGFLRHPQNAGLHQALRGGELSPQDYYRQLLRLVYRLIFVFVAEDRGVLQPPIADDLAPELAAERRRAQERYVRHYSTAKLRELALRRRGSVHGDRWIALRLILSRLHRGCPELDLPSLGSALFSPATTPDLERAELANQELLPAIRALCTFTDQAGVLRQVNWQNIGADELGSVFESLLELVPTLHRETGAFVLTTAAGNERKTTGSYYTPESLVECLLDSALDPVLDRACAHVQPERALLDLKVCDPACGSGHFVVAAGRRIAHRLAQVRAGDEEPSPEQRRRAFRDVYARCLYGVDLNPMAVELCKVSLWMEAIDPERPLPFLDGHIVQGNSLLGATPALIAGGIPDDAFKPIEGDDNEVAKRLRKRNRDERTGKAEGVQRGLFLAGDGEGTVFDHSAHRQNASAIEAMPDDTLAATEEKERRYHEYLSSDGVRELQLVADTWCSAFVWPKYKEHEESAPTHWVFEKIKREPGKAPQETVAVVKEVAREYEFLHWHLVFPQVFSVPADGEEHVDCGWSGGFDAVLGNPPWERIKLQEKEFFATRNESIAKAINAAARKVLISKLQQEDPALLKEWQMTLRNAQGESQFARLSARFPLCGRGDVNTYALFAELDYALLGRRGRAGIILPTGISTDTNTQHFFQAVFDNNSLVSMFSFAEMREFFPAMDSRDSFSLLTLCGNAERCPKAQIAFKLHSAAETKKSPAVFFLTSADIALLNPETKTCPIFLSAQDAEIAKSIYRGFPVFADAGWGCKLVRMFHMSDDSALFAMRDSLPDAQFEGNYLIKTGIAYVPLYEAKMIHIFDHRFGTYLGQTESQANQGSLPDSTPAEYLDPCWLPHPRYWVPAENVEKHVSVRWKWPHGWLLGWRDISRNSDQRTAIVSVFPRVGVGHTTPLILISSALAHKSGALVCNLSTFVFDYTARQKVGGTHLAFGTLKQLPILPPTAYDAPTPWHPTTTLAEWILPRVLELTYTAWDLIGFARDHGYDGPPYRWDEERRFWLRAELDAAYFHLYGLAPDEVDHVMESFWLVRQRDEKAHGSYRTKLAILDLYQRMADAAAKGHDYATVLDPPPADPSIAHPPLTAEQREQLAPILERALAAPAQPEPAPAAPTSASSPTAKPKRARAKPAPSTEPEHADTLPLFGHRPTVDYAKTAAAAAAPLLAAADAPPNLRSITPLADDPDSIRHLLAIEDPAITPDMIAVLRVLRRTDEPLGKAELLDAAGLDAKRWNPTINPLLDLGLVAKTGRGRGVKYLIIKYAPS